MTPQTIKFELRIHFRQIERSSELPAFKDFLFDSFEAMWNRYCKEKNRRALADRATSAEYRQVLTDHGKMKLAHGEIREESYRDAIEGNWLKLSR